MMGFVGLLGVSQALGGLSIRTGELTPMALSTDADFNAAMAAFQEALHTAPLARALAVANLLLSLLLVVASLRLAARAPTAFWWSKQALWANALYSLAGVCVHWYLFQSHPPLIEASEALAAAQVRLAGDASLASAADSPPRAVAALPLLGMTAAQSLLAAVYLGLLRLTRREDVRRFVLREV
jgi:hypothetical protein